VRQEHRLRAAGADLLHHAGELGGDDPLGRAAVADALEGLEVLQGHGLVVNALGLVVDLLQGQGVALGL